MNILTNDQIKAMISKYKFELCMHLETRMIHQVNTGYVTFLENKIEELKARLQDVKQAA